MVNTTLSQEPTSGLFGNAFLDRISDSVFDAFDTVAPRWLESSLGLERDLPVGDAPTFQGNPSANFPQGENLTNQGQGTGSVVIPTATIGTIAIVGGLIAAIVFLKE